MILKKIFIVMLGVLWVGFCLGCDSGHDLADFESFHNEFIRLPYSSQKEFIKSTVGITEETGNPRKVVAYKFASDVLMYSTNEAFTIEPDTLNAPSFVVKLLHPKRKGAISEFYHYQWDRRKKKWLLWHIDVII